MVRPSFILLNLAGFLVLLGCQSAQLHAVHEGETTWRSDLVPLDRDGGVVTVRVTGEPDEEVTVLLVDSSEKGELDKIRDAHPIAAAEGRTRDGYFEVRFTGLPPGTYYAHAFRDLDGDGCQTLSSFAPFGSEYKEPHSGFDRIDVTAGSRHEIKLHIPEERS